jgi:dTDP-4-amino-4,6-dideoxygalactose transaminase
MPENRGNIPFARPFTGVEEEEAVLRVLRSGWLTTGKETLEFEKEFAAFLQRPEGAASDLCCLAVNSATSGLHLALEACGLGKGDLALLPSYTFTSTAEVVRYLGAEAVFVDVVPGGFHLDPEALEKTLDRLDRSLPPYAPRPGAPGGFGPRGKARAIVPVHYGGLPCDMKALMAIAGKYGLKVVEDAAHSFPSFLPGAPLPQNLSPQTTGLYAGTIGDAGVFSFYATKTITTGEGGMIALRDKDMAGRIARMRSHGIDRSVWNRYTDTAASWYYEVIEPGYKYNIPDILSAIGRVQLSRARDLLTAREEIARLYDEAFREDNRFIIPPTGPGNARHLYPLRIARGSRDSLAEKLKGQGIGISVHFIPLHIMPYYKKRYGLEAGDFPHSLNSFRQVLSLPIWPGMTGEEVRRVIRAVKESDVES